MLGGLLISWFSSMRAVCDRLVAVRRHAALTTLRSRRWRYLRPLLPTPDETRVVMIPLTKQNSPIITGEILHPDRDRKDCAKIERLAERQFDVITVAIKCRAGSRMSVTRRCSTVDHQKMRSDTSVGTLLLSLPRRRSKTRGSSASAPLMTSKNVVMADRGVRLAEDLCIAGIIGESRDGEGRACVAHHTRNPRVNAASPR